MQSLVLGARTFEFGPLQLRRSMAEKPPKSEFELNLEAQARTLHRIKRMVRAGKEMTVDELTMLVHGLNSTLRDKIAAAEAPTT